MESSQYICCRYMLYSAFAFQIICSIDVLRVPLDGYFWPILLLLGPMELVRLRENC